MPLSFLRGAKRLRWRETDRLLALALRIHEDMTCSGCGQPMSDSMDPDLADWWSTMDAVRCHACTALAAAQKRDEGRDHPHALRHILGLRAGWEEAREQASAARRERAAADEQGDDAER